MIHGSIYIYIYISIYPFIHWSIYLLIYVLSTQNIYVLLLFLNLSIHPSIHPSIHLYQLNNVYMLASQVVIFGPSFLRPRKKKPGWIRTVPKWVLRWFRWSRVQLLGYLQLCDCSVWFGTWILWLSHHIGNVIIPTNIFQRGGSTTNQVIFDSTHLPPVHYINGSSQDIVMGPSCHLSRQKIWMNLNASYLVVGFLPSFWWLSSFKSQPVLANGKIHFPARDSVFAGKSGINHDDLVLKNPNFFWCLDPQLLGGFKHLD